MACPCYWGCGTPGNKLNWAFITLAFIAAAVLIGVGAGKGVPCFRTYQDCMDLFDSTKLCRELVEMDCPLRLYTGLIATGVCILLVAIPIMCIYFCCCAYPPGGAHGAAVAPDGMQMGGAGGPVVVAAVPYQPPGGYPPQGYGQQPYPAPPPGAYPQPYPAQQPYPPQPYPPPQQAYPPAGYAPQQPYPAYPPPAQGVPMYRDAGGGDAAAAGPSAGPMAAGAGGAAAGELPEPVKPGAMP
eukprot:CAMPEP_0202861832 /NCGR_PEP_ID=MMETSP1391-20130828/3093_1 /ASSEMBLY_ACC=CAM_ASM_000867 /TAXON_ID=1034604 /ORGANISM="Chlamydomonas leiostraca, Strain SAG 11-49" /LENGTH=240 /DNA_ID=CAMNT_0049541269 /DNA_START=109 /DNA_END=831 /DNA_ORIENTATION=-